MMIFNIKKKIVNQTVDLCYIMMIILNNVSHIQSKIFVNDKTFHMSFFFVRYKK